VHFLKQWPVFKLLWTVKPCCFFVKTIIAIAHNMNLKGVAEDVENAQQLEFLDAHACDMIQGYLVSPPLPAEDFTHYIDKDV